MSGKSVIHFLKRPPLNDPFDEVEWLFSALGQFTGAELRELLYIGQEPGFFETMRAVFALPEQSRVVLQEFLAAGEPQAVEAVFVPGGRCVLRRPASEAQKPPVTIAD